jgi:hypothetical protein
MPTGTTRVSGNSPGRSPARFTTATSDISRLASPYVRLSSWRRIHGEILAGVYGAYEDALKAGYEKFGLVPFLVEQIQAVEQVRFISRLVAPACPISPSN